MPQPSAEPERASAVEVALPRGAALGRYVVVARLGGGGMGVVYSAYDPELDRKLAVKLLRRSGDQARLLAEAQAMARLSHANVITVHDVGTVGDQGFIAMELLDSGTLRDWLGSERRGWRAVVQLFAQAARGLAAAHAAEIVHHDFKPENVLLGSDGKVCVTDFGLARRDPGAGAGGTRAYMSPEQHLGKPTDARSDQFSFCVALYEALYGVRPFAAEGSDGDLTTATTIAVEAMQGRVAHPPAGARVPSWLWRVVLRGLSVEAADRYPSMEAVVEALTVLPERRRRKRRVAAGLAGVAGLAVAGLLLLNVRDERAACVGAAQRLVGVWDLARKETVRAAFAASGKPFAATAWRTVERTVDDYAAHWVAQRTEACLATRVRHELSPQVLDLRMDCLDRRLRELDALAQLWSAADGDTVSRGPEAAAKLSSLAECDNVGLLTAVTPLPKDPAARTRIEEVRARLDPARAAQLTGKPKEILPRAIELAKAAEEIDYPPLLAEALYFLGFVQSALGDYPSSEATLLRALAEADRARHDALRARALLQLTFLATRRGDYPEAHQHARLAAAALERAGGDDEIAVSVAQSEAGTYQAEGRHDDALRLLQDALAISERHRPGDVGATKLLVEIGTILDSKGDSDGALAVQQRARQLIEENLGADNPTMGTLLNNMGKTWMRKGDPKRALGYFEQSLVLKQSQLGADSPLLLYALNNIGEMLYADGQVERAMDHFRRAVEVWEKVNGPDSPVLAYPLANLGLGELEHGRPGNAVPLLERALRLHDKANPEDRARAAFALARALAATGKDPARARKLAEQARADYASAKDHGKDVEAVARWLAGRP